MIEPIERFEYDGWNMDSDRDGKWVKYKDHMQIIEDLKRLLEAEELTSDIAITRLDKMTTVLESLKHQLLTTNRLNPISDIPTDDEWILVKYTDGSYVAYQLDNEPGLECLYDAIGWKPIEFKN